MNRLTELTYCGYDIKNRNLESDYTDKEIYAVLQKLGQLEDIEQKLKIDLITLFKALQNGFYYREFKTKEIKYCCNCWHFSIRHEGEGYEETYYFEIEDSTTLIHFADHGKTWALTREELL